MCQTPSFLESSFNLFLSLMPMEISNTPNFLRNGEFNYHGLKYFEGKSYCIFCSPTHTYILQSTRYELCMYMYVIAIATYFEEDNVKRRYPVVRVV